MVHTLDDKTMLYFIRYQLKNILANVIEEMQV